MGSGIFVSIRDSQCTGQVRDEFHKPGNKKRPFLTKRPFAKLCKSRGQSPAIGSGMLSTVGTGTDGVQLVMRPFPGARLVMGIALNATKNDGAGTAVQEVMMAHVATRTLTDPTSWGTLTLR